MAKTRSFDTAEYIDSPEAIAEYLTEAFLTHDPEVITKAIGTAARARGMSNIDTAWTNFFFGPTLPERTPVQTVAATEGHTPPPNEKSQKPDQA